MAQVAEPGKAKPQMALPEGISQEHVEGKPGMLRGFLPVFILGALLLAAMLGLFGGGHDPTVSAEGRVAKISVTAPQKIRNGEFFEIDIVVSARRPIAKPVVAISSGYLFDVTVNTHIPEPKDMGFEDGQFRLEYPAMKAGDQLLVKLDGQVNPTLVGQNSGQVSVLDDKTPLVRRPVHLWVYP